MKSKIILLLFVVIWALHSEATEERFSFYCIDEAYANRNVATDLILNNAPIVEFPPELFALTNLVGLHMSSSSFQYLSSDIEKLHQLRWLSIRGSGTTNCLQFLPPEIGSLTNLISLSICNHPTLTTLPEEIGNLIELRELALWQNGLSRLPASIGNLSKLERLFLSNNNLQEIPSEIGRLKALKKLSLRGNMLTDLPDELYEIAHLEELSLSSNKLSILSPSISKLEKLKWLSLFQNQIYTFPDEIKNLKQLERMSVGLISEDEGRRLERLLPNCKISWFENKTW